AWESKHGKEDDAMFVVTGATGHTGNLVAKALLTKGEKVRVIGRNTDRLKDLVREGAEPFTADLTDKAATSKVFAGGKAVYLMIPPNITVPDVRSYQNRVVDAIAAAIQGTGITHAVTLSSIGADKS